MIEQDENEVVSFFISFYPTDQKFVVSKIYFKSKLMLLFSKNPKETLKTSIMVQIIYNSNKCFSFEFYINQRILKNVS